MSGWAAPGRARKWHYFANGPLSLCRLYLYFGAREDHAEDSPANCVACTRVLRERRKRPA